jgi:hypothetical protein
LRPDKSEDGHLVWDLVRAGPVGQGDEENGDEN